MAAKRATLPRKTKSAEDQLDLLLAASGRLQDDLKQVTELEAASRERDLLLELINRVPDQLFVKDMAGRFLVANDAVATDKTFLTGEKATARSIIGKSDFDLYPPELATKFWNTELEILKAGEPWTSDMRDRFPDGSGWSSWVSMTKIPLKNAKGQVIGLLGVARDITARKQAEERLQYLAHHDPLTELPNRELFSDRLGQAILKGRRSRKRLSVVFLDIDKFKLVNDSLGHLAGDTLLRTIAGRLTGCLRTSDTVARLGGDEFVILVDDPPGGMHGLEDIISRIRSSIAEPINLAGQQFSVTTSIGIATFPEDGTVAEALLANADAAMYRAKDLGRDNFQFYSAGMTASALERLALVEGLRKAVAANELILHFQPLVELQSGRVFGAEALLRWNRPGAGMVPPMSFIPAAEDTGLIVPIGKWALHAACAQNARWQRAGYPHIAVSVNVSARQFLSPDLVESVREALAASGLSPHYLELELSESMIMQDLHKSIATMQELDALGVQLSIDDFGTGYSSLSALKSFPVNRLKIDKSFVHGMSDDEDGSAITSAIISLGQKLHMRVIAEGVETAEQVAFLAANGCDEVQGYHFGRPVAAEAFPALAWPKSS